MAKKQLKGFYRIKDLSTGLYYNKRSIRINDAQGKYAGSTNWDNFGSVWDKRGPAESQVTSLTKTFKADRDTEAKMILFGNKKTYNIRVIEALVEDKK